MRWGNLFNFYLLVNFDFLCKVIQRVHIFIFIVFAGCNFLYAQNCECVNEEKIKTKFERQIRKFYFDSLKNDLANLKESNNINCVSLSNRLNALLAYRLSKFKESKQYLDEEINILKSQSCPRYKYINNYFIRGLVYSDTDLHDSAAIYLLKSLNLAQDNKVEEIVPKLYQSLAGVYAKLRDFDKSLEYIRMSIAINERNKNFYLLANNYSTQASIFTVFLSKNKTNANYNDSIIRAQQLGFENARKSKNIDALLSLYYKKATILTSKKDFVNAEKYLDSSIMFSLPIIHIKNLCGAYSHKAFLFSRLGNYDKSIQFNDSSLKYATKLGATSSIIGIYKFAYEVYSKKSDYRNALIAHEKMTIYSDSLNLFEKAKTINELEQKYNQIKNEKLIMELSQKEKIDKLQIRSLIAFVSIAILLIIILIFFYRQSVVKGKLRTMETEQRLNRARMNPHFFFNALASIQNLSLIHEKRDLVPMFISKFSKIMRQSLESTFNEMEILENEIGFLTDYLELQKLRSENRFNYQFKIDENIDLSEIKIPTMILQPFVENAIEHGFKNLSYLGLLSISFSQNQNRLIIIISDNGNGDKQLDKNMKAFPSRATQIIKDRLYLLNKIHKTIATFDITNSASETGTKVEIRLPIVT